MGRVLAGIAISASLVLASAGPLVAQAGMPGGRGGSAPTHLARYYAYMLEKVQEITSDFERAWREGDRDRLQELYYEESWLVVDGGFRVRGQEAIYRRLTELFPRRRNVRLTLVDLEADGYMGVVFGELGDAPGKHVTVIMRKGGDWRIVRQFFMGVESEEAAVAGNPPS